MDLDSMQYDCMQSCIWNIRSKLDNFNCLYIANLILNFEPYNLNLTVHIWLIALHSLFSYRTQPQMPILYIASDKNFTIFYHL
jgi:hypothetical protein